MQRHYHNSISKQVLGLMEVMEPGSTMAMGQLSHEDQIARGAMALAEEYKHLTGHPIMQILKDEARQAVSEESEALPLG